MILISLVYNLLRLGRGKKKKGRGKKSLLEKGPLLFHSQGSVWVDIEPRCFKLTLSAWEGGKKAKMRISHCPSHDLESRCKERGEKKKKAHNVCKVFLSRALFPPFLRMGGGKKGKKKR